VSQATHEDVVGSTAPAAVELVGVTKTFPGVVANDDVNLRVAPGEIHAVVGENGAGKSTLMKILYGIQRPDSGTISVNGVTQRFRSPKDAIGLGIGMVHQHFQLADNLTVLENVILGSEPTLFGDRIDFAHARKAIAEVGERYGLRLDPDELVAELTVGERQRLEILKALYRGARILILDEPTAVLVPQEVEELFHSLRQLTHQGVTVIFISHKLDEVLSVSDAITVIRAGRTVATVKPTDVTAHRLAELMVGSELPTPETTESTVTDVVELEVRGLTVLEGDRAVVDDVSFVVRKGEVVGIAGVEGNGQTELVHAILGIIAPARGTILLGGQDITATGTRERREAGMGYIPQDRQREGLLLEAPLWENAMLGHQSSVPYARGLWVDRNGARDITRKLVADYDVRTPSIDVAAHALSGGNQQKLIFGREMEAEPSVLIAAQPTRGIDVGAQAAIWDNLRVARRRGLAVLLVSADLEELIGLSDTLRVILRGRLVATLNPAQTNPEELGSYMTGVNR
jgi:ABC-type uncharacterized transport system ATPase subunit